MNERTLEDTLWEAVEKSNVTLKKLMDGVSKNVNPLKEIPNPQMRLYVVECNCFKTKEELMDYCQKENIPFDDTYILDYLGNVAGRSDVIRKIDYNGQSHLYTAIDTDGYAIYNEARSTYRGEFVWEYEYGDIRSFYNSFRSRGIRFSHDVYGKIDEGYQKLLRMIKK